MGELGEGLRGLLLALLAVFVWMALKVFRELDGKNEKSIGEGGDKDVKKHN